MSSSSIEFGVTSCLCLSSIVLTTSLILMPLISENCFSGSGGVTSNDFGALSTASAILWDDRLRLRSWNVCLPWRSDWLTSAPLRPVRPSRRAPGAGAGLVREGLRLGAPAAAPGAGRAGRGAVTPGIGALGAARSRRPARGSMVGIRSPVGRALAFELVAMP